MGTALVATNVHASQQAPPRAFMQLPPPQVKPISMITESSISCSLFDLDSMMQFDLSALQNQNEGFYYKDGYFFNFCAQLSLTNDGSQIEAYVFKADDATATNYTAGMNGVPFTEKIITSSKTGRIDEIDANNNSIDYHIETYFENSVPCGTNTWGTYFDIYCDSSKDGAPSSDDFTVTADEATCKLTISTSHAAGCPVFSLQGLLSFLRSIPVLLALIMIFMGLATNFFGAKIFRYISGGINSALVFINSFIIFSLLISSMKPAKAISILLTLVGIVVGLMLGFLAYNLSKSKVKYGATILAAFAGLFFGFMIYRYIFQHLWSNIVFMMLVVFAVGGFAALYTWRFASKIVLPLTVIMGSYLLVRGISIMIDGGVPSNFSMFGDSSSVLGVFYYLMGYGLCIGLGITFQKHHHYDDLHKEECDTDHSDEEEEE